MAKPAVINPNAPEEAEAVVRQLIDANPGQLTPQHFRFKVYHLSDPTSSVGQCIGSIDYERFSEEAVAQQWGVAGFFYAELLCRSSIAPGTLKRVRFGIAEQLIPRGATPAALAGLAPAAPTAPSIDMTALLLAQMKQQGDLLIAMLGRPAAPTSAPMSDRIIELLFSQAVNKTPAADLINFFDAMKKRTAAAADDTDEEEPEPRGSSLAVEALRLFRQLAKSGPAMPPPPPPSPAETPASPSPTPTPTPVPTPAAEAERVDPAKLGDIDKLRLFGRRVVPQLIDYATDPAPSIDAAAAMVEATALRCGLNPKSFATTDDVADDIVDPVIAFYPELTPHRAFAIAAVEAVADEYDDDDQEPGE